MVLKFIYSEKATQFCEIFPLHLTVCTVVKSKGKISQNFVAFSEYMNFTYLLRSCFNPTSLQAEVYVNLLEGDSVDEDSLIQKNTGEESWSTINSEDSKNLQELQNLEFLDNSGGTGNNIEESDEVSSVSTLSTIQSCHVTPLATPTVGLSKHTTPNSSFSTHDKRRNSFKRSQMKVSSIAYHIAYS